MARTRHPTEKEMGCLPSHLGDRFRQAIKDHLGPGEAVFMSEHNTSQKYLIRCRAKRHAFWCGFLDGFKSGAIK